MSTELQVAVIGLNMGLEHVHTYSGFAKCRITALCDHSEELLNNIHHLYPSARPYLDYQKMLAEEKIDILCIATPTHLHKEMVLKAADFGVKAIYCEKPIATNLEDAYKMRDACKEKEILLVIGHQRRMSSVYKKMKEIMDSGYLGDILSIRGSCPGDLLSDGTHTIDSMLFLNNEMPAKNVLAQVYRGRKATKEELLVNPYLYSGSRYGHLVEEGAIASISFDNKIRGEILCGTMWQEQYGYQCIEVIGSKGRLIRKGDQAEPPIMVQQDGDWKPFSDEIFEDNGLESSHSLLVDQFFHKGIEHPMSIDHALLGFELLMGIYESARLNEEIQIPPKQMKYPLDIMVQALEEK